MSRRPEDDDNKWHLDRKVPLALIVTIVVTILIQTAAGSWWLSSLSERVASVEKRAEATAPQADRLTRVEVKLDVVQENLGEIKRLIQQRR